MESRSDYVTEFPSIVSRTTAQQVRRHQRGQAAVEFALVLTVAMIVLFVAIQMALIGQVALALGQVNYQGARYAAVHPDCDLNSCQTAGETDINDYMKSVASPTITWTNVTLSICDGTGTCSGDNTTVPRTFGNSVTVAMTYDCTGNLFFGKSFLGINFPTTLNSSETAMSE